MLSGDGNENGKKKINTGRLKLTKNNNNNNNNCARAAHFFVRFFAVVLHDYNVKRPETSKLQHS